MKGMGEAGSRLGRVFALAGGDSEDARGKTMPISTPGGCIK